MLTKTKLKVVFFELWINSANSLFSTTGRFHCCRWCKYRKAARKEKGTHEWHTNSNIEQSTYS